MKQGRFLDAVSELRKHATLTLLEQGFDVSDIALVLGCTFAEVISLRDTRAKPVVVDPRIKTMADLYRNGETLEQIGSKFGLTRERVRQILRRAGVEKSEGGRSVSTERKREQAAKKRDDACMRKYGCTHEQYQILMGIQRNAESRDRGPIGAYARQKNSAAQRGIPFTLTLWQWWTIWQESGHWEQRGRGRGMYCMARIGDSGAYEVGNVRIVTNEENIAESYEVTPIDKRFCRVRDELGLLPFQRKIFDIAITGKVSPKAIANDLGLSPGTVATSLVDIRRIRPEIKSTRHV